MAIECPRCGLPRFYGPTGLAAPQCMCAGGYQLAAAPAQAQQAVAQVYRYGKDSAGKPWHGINPINGADILDGSLLCLADTKADTAPHPDTADAARGIGASSEGGGNA